MVEVVVAPPLQKEVVATAVPATTPTRSTETVVRDGSSGPGPTVSPALGDASGNRVFLCPGSPYRKTIVTGILSIGMAPCLVNVCGSAVTVAINRQLADHGGDLAIGAYGYDPANPEPSLVTISKTLAGGQGFATVGVNIRGSGCSGVRLKGLPISSPRALASSSFLL